MSSLEEQLLEFLYACPVGLIECDRRGEIGMINPHAMQHLLPLAGPGGATNLFKALDQHAPEIRNGVDRFAAASGKICDNHPIIVDLGGGRREGEPKVLACTIVKLAADRFMVTLADVSIQVAQEKRLRQADAWFASLLDTINDYAVLTITTAGLIDGVNDAFTRQTGHACAEIVGCPLPTVLRQDGEIGGLSFADELRLAGRDGWFLQEGWQQRKDGRRYWCQRLIVARPDQEGMAPIGFLVVLRDVPQRDVAASELRRLLTSDHLTGAANRMEFRRVLERLTTEARASGQPLALLMLDLDHFKSVNDRHGHPTGDVLLRQVALACTDVLRPCDLFARLGGEEFAALLPGLRPEEVSAVGSRLRSTVGQVVVEGTNGVRVGVTASLGCAMLSEAGGSIDTLIDLADQRLYVAKRGGRNCVQGPEALAA